MSLRNRNYFIQEAYIDNLQQHLNKLPDTSGNVFTKEQEKEVAQEIKSSIAVPVIQVSGASLGKGGFVGVHLSLDEKKDWSHGIFENSRYMSFAFRGDGSLELLSRGYQFKDDGLKKFRKVTVKSVQEAVKKIKEYIKLAESVKN